MRRNDLRIPDAEADLYLVGLGIGGFDRRTVEAHEVLASCGAIFHLTAFDNELRRRYDAHVVDLRHLYESDDDPGEVYCRMTAAVRAAVDDFAFRGPAAFLCYGHPLFLVDSSWDLLAIGHQEGFRVKAVPGTSFVDQALVDLGVRMDRAVQVYEATLFVRDDVVVDSRFPLLLSQVGDFASSVLRPWPDSGGDRIGPLAKRLQSVFPPNRRVALFLSPWREDMAPQVTGTTIQELSDALKDAHVGNSLLIEGDEAGASCGDIVVR